MRVILLVPIALLFSVTAANAGPCPDEVTEGIHPEGSAVGTILKHYAFRDVSFYAGDPKDNDGVPSDDNSEGPRKLEQYWELTRAPGKPITMVCRYHDTDKTVASVVPANVKGCTLSGEMDAQGEVLGSPTLECK